MAHRKTIYQMIQDKELDLLLVLELEKERLYPNRSPQVLFGQFVLLYDLVPTHQLNTILMEYIDIKNYFLKFLEKEKNIFEEDLPKNLLTCTSPWIERIVIYKKKLFLINSKHNLKLLDEDKK